MNVLNIIKSTFIYKYIYHPYSLAKRKKLKKQRRVLFLKEGVNALKIFADCLNSRNIPFWLEYGTLLGAFRDNSFVPNELDLDIGAYLKDAKQIFNALKKSGFVLVREFHIVGENGLEQTYSYKGTTLDVMYFFHEKSSLFCTGANFDLMKVKKNKPFFTQATSHKFKNFQITKYRFYDIDVWIPSNTEEHLIEIYGPTFRVYDPNFKVDLNKTFYPLDEKKCIGFVNY